ncbi:MAG: hypothetical protein E7038_00920 [Lentisphaerae bacterium]|nr:hypothetical protein [Lentisphaerota bacterium]
MIQNFLKKNSSALSAAVFLSGSGTNAEKILARNAKNPHALWLPSVIVTERPGCDAAKRFAETYNVPLVVHDLVAFYKAHGLEKTGCATEEGRAVRKLWTDALREMLKPYPIDFAIFAGFVPLTDIVEDFPCLNIHPGDLTVLDENGERLLVGLHAIPVEMALMKHLPYLRSSVIVLESFRSTGVDGGALLGVSAPVPIDWTDEMRRTVDAAAAARIGKKRAEYKNDALGQIAAEYLEKLKVNGDWVVFPQVVDDFAAGHFAYDRETGTVHYDGVPATGREYTAETL